MNDYVMSARAISNGQFVDEVADTPSYLIVPPGQNPAPGHAKPKDDWFNALLKDAAWKNAQGQLRGDILFFVHGYNMDENEIMYRHRRLRDDLVGQEGFLGVVVSIDWPSGSQALAYLADRHHAKETAMQLVSGGIAELSARQTPECPTNVHLLAHSTGAYVIREAFHDADDSQLKNSAWMVSQLMFAAGDVSSDSLSADDRVSASIFRHCVRMTNYSNRNDMVLDLSNVKRIGLAPRAGRQGLPAKPPANAINVNCTQYYEDLAKTGALVPAVLPPAPPPAPPAADPLIGGDQPYGYAGVQSHSWYFGNRMFTRDVFNTIIGVDRTVIPTRAPGPDGLMWLKHVNVP